MKPKPIIRPFDQAAPYEQHEPGDAQFNRLLAAGEFPGIVSGRVRLNGPIHKTAASHDTWDQIYVVLAGSALLHLGETSAPVSGPTIVTIPRGTRHSVELKAGESIDYIYVNQNFTH